MRCSCGSLILVDQVVHGSFPFDSLNVVLVIRHREAFPFAGVRNTLLAAAFPRQSGHGRRFRVLGSWGHFSPKYPYSVTGLQVSKEEADASDEDEDVLTVEGLGFLGEHGPRERLGR